MNDTTATKYTLRLTFCGESGRFVTRTTKGMPWEKAMDYRESLIARNPALYRVEMIPEVSRG